MRSSKLVIGYLVLLDAAGIALAMVLSYYLRVAGNVIPYYGPRDVPGYLGIAFFILPVWLAVHALNQLYCLDLLFDGLEEYMRVIRASSFCFVALAVASFWERRTLLSRGWVLITWFSCIAFVVGGRFWFRRWIYRQRARGRMATSVLLVGASERGIAMARQLQEAPRLGARVVGFLDDDLAVGAVVMEDVEVLGPPRDLEYLVAQSKADEVIVVPDGLAWESLQEIVRRAAALSSNGVRVRLSPGVYESLTTGVQIYHKASMPLLTIHDIRFTGTDAVCKAALDYGLAAVLLAISIPGMLLAAVYLGLSNSTPVIHRRRMLGLNGAPFTQFRFHTGADADTRRTLARSSLCPGSHSFSGVVGRVLYLTGFDKAPQLWNVLRGEMSLVGARASKASDPIPEDTLLTRILSVKPGMTGLWALTDDTSVDYELRSTLYYIRNWNILLDLQILLRTMTVALFGRLKKMHVEPDPQELISKIAIARSSATAEPAA
jgi:lipopolysaccharide/colanic/teichoic acid biosynthesis glycosyltransferase